MTTPEPTSLLLGALGGQGGGVLTNWLVEAARLAGYPAQATSIPGVAQRTGATTYYFEIFPVRNPPDEPVFCLFPSAANVNIVVALEPTEAGRAMEDGYVTRRTTVITTTQRVYSTAEKSIAGDGRLEAGPVLEALRNASARLIQVDGINAGARENALLFGAVIGSGVLPVSVSDARQAIENLGPAVQANLAGFELGLACALNQNGHFHQGEQARYDPAPPGFEKAMEIVPETIRPLIGHALARLVDYQNDSYAHLYLSRLAPILEIERQHAHGSGSYGLTREVARRLASWMCREDVVRVAQLKTRKGRLNRIRQEIGAQAGEPVQVIDYLSPGQAELAGILPAAITRWFLKDGGRNLRNLHLPWPSSTPPGYAALKFLASLRALRRFTLAYARENAAIEDWLEAVRHASGVDYSLACRVAELAVWARGYGDVRERGLACLEDVLRDWEKKVEENPEAVKLQVQASLRAARNDPDRACHGG